MTVRSEGNHAGTLGRFLGQASSLGALRRVWARWGSSDAAAARDPSGGQVFATRCRAGDCNLPAAFNRPVAFARYARYRCVVRKDMWVCVVDKVAALGAF